MSGAVKTLTLELIGKDTGVGRMFDDSGNKVAAFQKKVEGSSRSLSAGAIAAKGLAVGATAVAAGLSYAITKAVAFDKAMRNVNSLVKGNEQQFAAMEKQVISMSTKLPQSATTLAEGLYDIASSGFQGADGMKVLDAAARSASAGLTTTETSAKAITAVLNAYGMNASQAADVSDVLFSTVNLGVISFSELAGNLGDVVGATAAAKVGIDQVGAAIATMTLSGIKGAQATTALSSLTTKLVQPSTALAELYGRLGYESGAAALEQKGLRGVLEDVRKATGGNITAMLQLFPDIEAARGALALMANDGANYAKVSDQITDKTKRMGATQAVLDEQMKSVSAQWQLMTNRIDAAAISVGVKILPALSAGMAQTQNFGAAVGKMAIELKDKAGPGLDGFGEAAQNVGKFLEELGHTVLTMGAGIAQAVGPEILDTFNALGGVLADITGLAMDNQGAVVALGLAYAVHAGGGVAALNTGLDALSAGLSTSYDFIAGLFTPGVEGVADSWTKMGDRAKAAGSKMKAAFLEIAPAAAIGATLAVAVVAWQGYSKAAERAGDVTKSAGKAMSSIKTDELQAELQKAQAYIDDYNTRLEDIGTSNSFGGAMSDFFNVGKNFETLGMQDNLEKVQSVADQTSQRIGQLQYNTVELFKIMGKPVPDEAKWINDVQGANGASAQAAAMSQMNAALTELGPKLKEAGVDMGAAWDTQQLTNAYAALNGVKSGTDQAAEAQGNLIEAMGGAASAMGDAGKAADDLKSSLDALMGASLGLDEAQIQWLDGLAKTSKTLKENKGDLDLNSEGGRKNRSAIIDQVESLQDLLVAGAEAGEGQAQLTGRLASGRQALINAGQAAGISKARMVELLAQYKLTPELVKTLITESGAASTKEKLAEVERQAKLLDRQKPKPKVSAETGNAQSKLNAVQARLDAIDGRNATSTVTVRENTFKTMITTNILQTQRPVGVMLPEANGGIQSGGIPSYADGKLPKQAMIARGQGGGLVQWAEQETGGEAFIPLAPGKRNRSEKILGKVADQFGMALVEKYASGGFRYPAFKFNYEKFEFEGNKTDTPAERNKERAKALAKYNADRQKARTDAYRTWIENRYRAYEDYKDRVRLAATAMGRSEEGRAKITGQADSTISGVGEAAENRAQAYAELQAIRSKNTADSAEDFYKKPIVSLKAYTDALKSSEAAQRMWGVEMRKVTNVVGADVVETLRGMGDEGEAIVKKMSKGTVKEMLALAEQVRKIEFASFINDSMQDAKAAQQFNNNLMALVRMGRADLAQKFSEMGVDQAGGLAAQAVKSPGSTLAGLAAQLNVADNLNSPEAKDALEMASLLQTLGRRVGIVGLSEASGKSVADVMGLLQRFDSTIFKNLSPYVMQFIRGDQARIKSGKQPSGFARGTIIPGSETGYYWGEPESGGESLIPHGMNQRRRARDLWNATGRILGVAAGGGGQSVVIAPGAISVTVPVSGSSISPAQVESAVRSGVSGAVNQLADILTRGQR
jgi:TP901 family phage tail tape measure protein